MKQFLLPIILLTPFSLFSQDWSWQNPVPTGNTLFSVQSLSDEKVVAVGGSSTIITTTDGGVSWMTQQGGSVGSLTCVYFPDGQNGWAVGGAPLLEGVILRTTDGGTSWSPQASGTTQLLEFVWFTSATRGWVTGGGGTILRTTNGGINWTAQPSGVTAYMRCVFFVDSLTGWAIGNGGTIVKTTDGGTTWSRQVSGTTTALFTVQFLDPSNGWIVGGNPTGVGGIILHTTDGGTTWITQAGGLPATLRSVYLTDIDTGWVVGENGTILFTWNGGNNWVPQTSGTTSTLRTVWFAAAGMGWAVGSNGAIVKTSDGGATWIAQSKGTVQQLNSVYMADAYLGWSVGNGGTILRTTDGGSAWEAQPSGTTVTLRAVSFADRSTGWVAGNGGTILKTTNGGAVWSVQTSGSSSILYAVRFIDGNTGWVAGNSGTSLKTTNGGASWAPQASGTTNVLRSIFFTDADNGWMVGDLGTILHTTNGGTMWTVQTAGTSNALYSVYFADGNKGWIGGTAGTILRTTTGGSTWILQAEASIYDFESVVFADPDNGVVAGTARGSDKGGAILRTTDGGYMWNAQATGSGNSFKSTSFIDANRGWTVGNTGSILATTTGGTGIEPPAPPELLSPQDSSSEPGNPTLGWAPLPEALWYTLQVSTSRFFNGYQANLARILPASHQLFGLQEGLTYYWHVSVTTSAGTSGWSVARSFTVSQGTGPVVQDIPGESIARGNAFAVFDLDDFVNDPDFSDAEMEWTVSGNMELLISIDTAHAVTISPPDLNWTGSEVVTFLVTDPDGLNGSDTARFEVTALSPNPIRINVGGGEYTDIAGDLFVADRPYMPGGFGYTGGIERNQLSPISGTEDDPLYQYYRDGNDLGYSFDIPNAMYNVTCLFMEPLARATGRRVFDVLAEGVVVVDNLDVFARTGAIRSAHGEVFQAAVNDGQLNLSFVPVSGRGAPLVCAIAVIPVIQKDGGVVAGRDSHPQYYSLHQNYPNPFNPSTKIWYDLPWNSHVSLEIFDVLGQLVRRVVDEFQMEGHYGVTWDGRNESGSAVATGIYLYRLQASPSAGTLSDGQIFVETKKLILMK